MNPNEHLKNKYEIYKLKLSRVTSRNISKKLHLTPYAVTYSRKNTEKTLPDAPRSYGILTHYRDEIYAFLEAQYKLKRRMRMRCAEYYAEFLKAHPEIEAAPKFATFMRYVGKCKKLIGYKRGFHLSLKHYPHECQVDFGLMNFYLAGEYKSGYYAVMSFPNSAFAYVQVLESKNIESILHGLQNIIEHIGCAPTEMWLDNESAIIHAQKVHPLFSAFCEHYSINPVFMNEYSAYEKGNVENRIGYLRRNIFVPVPAFDDIDEYNKTLFAACEKILDRPHYKHDFNMLEQFRLDTASFAQNKPERFVIESHFRRRINKAFRVNIQDKYYFVPPENATRNVDVVLTYNRIKIYNAHGELILDHKRLRPNEHQEVDWLVYLPHIAKYPSINALKPFINRLPVELKYFLLTSEDAAISELLTNIVAIAKEHDLAVAIAVAQECVVQSDISAAAFGEVAENKKQPTNNS